MKTPLQYASLAVLSAAILTSCSRSDLKTGMEYKHSAVESPFGATVYVFSDQTVSVYKEVGNGENICIRKRDGEIVTSATGSSRLFNNLRGVGAPKGSTLSRSDNDDDAMTVIFGPGDRMPVLESAPYKIQGTSVYVDWSQNHSKYFALSRCGSDSEVFTIKNEGLVLESSTRPGFTLTMGGRALTSAEQHMHDEREEWARKTEELAREKRELRGR